jgi:hypothetical protein
MWPKQNKVKISKPGDPAWKRDGGCGTLLTLFERVGTCPSKHSVLGRRFDRAVRDSLFVNVAIVELHSLKTKSTAKGGKFRVVPTALAIANATQSGLLGDLPLGEVNSK